MRSLRPVAGLLRPYRALFAGGVVTNLMVHVCTFGAAVAGAVLIGEALEGSPSSELWPFVWVIVVLAVPIALFGWLEVVVVHVMSFRLIDDLRTRAVRAVPGPLARVLPVASLGRRRAGVDGRRRAARAVHVAPGPAARRGVRVPVLAEIGLWIVEPILAVVVLPFVVAAASVPSWLLGRAQDEGERLREELGELGANVVDVVQGTREVLAASGEEVMLDRIERQHERIRATSISHGRRSGIEHAATDAITALAAITVVTTTAVLATNGSFDTASIPVALILAAGAFAPLASLTGTFREVGQVSAAAERIEALMAARAARDRPCRRGGLGRSTARGRTAAPGRVRRRVVPLRRGPARRPRRRVVRDRGGGDGSRSSATRAPGSRRARTCCCGCGTCARAR